MSVSFADVIAPIRYRGSDRIAAVNINFSYLPPSQKIVKAYAFEEEIGGVTVEALSDKFPNLGVLRLEDIGIGLQTEVYKLEYGKNWVRPLNDDAVGIELWFRPGAMCDVIIYVVGD